MVEDRGRVVIVSQNYPPDKMGNASRISDTSKHLQSEGWEVTVLAPPPAFPHGQFERSWERKDSSMDDGVRVHRLWAWQPTVEDPSFLSRIAYYVIFPLHALFWMLLHHKEYDAIITSSPPIFTGFAGLPFGLVGWKPWIVDVRDLWIDASIGLGFIEGGGLIERASRAYQRIVLRSAERVTVTTKVLGERLVDEYGIDSDKIVNIPNGVNTTVYQPDQTESEPVIVYAGNLGHAQALDSCVVAMSKLNDSEVRFKIVGDGDIREDLEKIVSANGLEDRVEFTGLVPREEIPEILNKAMVGVAPLKEDDTLEYAVPTKAYEYMACELPVVTTGVGEIEILMEESGGGLFVENKPDKMADAFESLLNNSKKRDLMGESGRKHVVEHYDRGVVAAKLSATLDEVVST